MLSPAVAGLRFEIVPEEEESGDAGGSRTLTARLLETFPRPDEVTLTVTSLPQHGVERTIDASIALAELGFHVVPHLPARSFADRAALRTIVRRMHAAGIVETFAISGDARAAAGEYSTSFGLIRDMRELDPTIAIGVAGYPEGHPQQSDERLMQHLLDRAPYIASVITQLCFSPDAIAAYARRLREAGIGAALWAGVPGIVDMERLASLSERLGVGPSKELLGTQGRPDSGAAASGEASRATDATDEACPGWADEFDSVAFVRSRREHSDLAGDSLAGVQVYTFNDLSGLPAFARAVTVKHA